MILVGTMPLNKEKFVSPTIYTIRNFIWKIRPWKGINSGLARFCLLMANVSQWSYLSHEEYVEHLILDVSKLNTPNGRKLRSM
jgi:hypothetical protein